MSSEEKQRIRTRAGTYEKDKTESQREFKFTSEMGGTGPLAGLE